MSDEVTRSGGTRKPPGFFDVFISYRHDDAGKIDDLARQIRDAGLLPFRDLEFPSLQDPSNVTHAKIVAMREILSQATCLIFAFSQKNARRQARSGNQQVRSDEGQVKSDGNRAASGKSTVGSWMPWELGFFDGCISDRIGVYLLDGDPPEFEPKEYFRHAEFLQLYQPLVAKKTTAAGLDLPPHRRIMELEPFLERLAVRERRIDNVRAGFVWAEHLIDECLANPGNVALGVAEWHLDHLARQYRALGAQAASEGLYQLKGWLDDTRVTWARYWRSPLVYAWISAKYAQRQAAVLRRAERSQIEASTSTKPQAYRRQRPASSPDVTWPGLALLQDFDTLPVEPATRAPADGQLALWPWGRSA